MANNDNKSVQVTFTPEKLVQLKQAYEAAVSNELTSFLFDGNEYLVSYAKYLIEYLELHFGEIQ